MKVKQEIRRDENIRKEKMYNGEYDNQGREKVGFKSDKVVGKTVKEGIVVSKNKTTEERFVVKVEGTGTVSKAPWGKK